MTTIESLVDQAAEWAPSLTRMRAAFMGCGDSLAASRPAENYGHRVVSAGDVAWTGQAPGGTDVSIALSFSGRTGATVKAAETVRDDGQIVWAITSDKNSPLAQIADRHLELPSIERPAEELPTWGFALHSLAVHAILGHAVDLEKVLQGSGILADSLIDAFPKSPDAPYAISFPHLPDSHSTAEFWSLKLIEATGIAGRVVALEEIGHVDYFIGPQPHLVLLPLVTTGHQRAQRLSEALRKNGQTVIEYDLRNELPDLNVHEFALALSLAGGPLGATAARAWGRPPFRGGQVDMSAQHIQVPEDV